MVATVVLALALAAPTAPASGRGAGDGATVAKKKKKKKRRGSSTTVRCRMEHGESQSDPVCDVQLRDQAGRAVQGASVSAQVQAIGSVGSARASAVLDGAATARTDRAGKVVLRFTVDSVGPYRLDLTIKKSGYATVKAGYRFEVGAGTALVLVPLAP